MFPLRCKSGVNKLCDIQPACQKMLVLIAASDYANPVTFIAVSRIFASEPFRMCRILGIALEAPAVLPASALRVVFAPLGRTLADVTMF